MTSALKRSDIISSLALLVASEEILERRKTGRKEWISDDKWGRIAKRKEIEGILLNAVNETEETNLRTQYREANKVVKKKRKKKLRGKIKEHGQKT